MRNHATTRQSQVRILSPPLVLTVAKSGYRRVIRKAGVERRRPFCVLGQVPATTCDADGSLKVSLSTCRAMPARGSVATPRTRSGPKLSAVSLSRAGWVNGCCFRSVAPNRLGMLSDSSR